MVRACSDDGADQTYQPSQPVSPELASIDALESGLALTEFADADTVVRAEAGQARASPQEVITQGPAPRKSSLKAAGSSQGSSSESVRSDGGAPTRRRRRLFSSSIGDALPSSRARRKSMPICSSPWRSNRSTSSIAPLPGEVPGKDEGRSSWAVAQVVGRGAALKVRRNSSVSTPARVVPAGLKFCRSATAKAAELKCSMQVGDNTRWAEP
jgi:hypothetical protein